jgi:hypothetical protein
MTASAIEQSRHALRAETLFLAILAMTMALSSVVVVEPAPYEAFIFLLAGALMLTGVSIDLMLVPLIALIGLWAIGGAFALIPVSHIGDSLKYYFVSMYMGMNALVFACVLSRNTMRRLNVLLSGYVVAALFAAVLGIVAYFRLVPGAESMLLSNRATALFKDPNVYGPFLILPVLYFIQSFIYRGFRPLAFIVMLIIMMGLFLSFSRGAWGHFVASSLTMLTLMVMTSRSYTFRWRILGLAVLALVALALILIVMLSFSSIGDVFRERANLLNYYDVGEQGRFGRQAAGLARIFDYPNGLGPMQFAATFGIDPHNVYLNSLYTYGWTGGLAYFGMVISTLIVGWRGVFARAPWQPILIAFYATYVGVVLEGFIIDTDHWRHYFLLIGGIWGLTIASLRGAGRGDGAVAA